MTMRAGVALLAMALPAAADQANVDVGAQLIGTCKIGAVTPIDFGDLVQSTNSPDRIAYGSLAFWCSKGLRYTVTVDDGQSPNKGSRRMKGQVSTNATEYLTYDLRPRGRESGTGLGPQYPE